MSAKINGSSLPIAAQAFDDGSIDVDLSELEAEHEAEPPVPSPARAPAGTGPTSTPMLDRMRLLAAGQVLEKLPNIDLVESLRVGGVEIKDFQKALKKYRDSIDKEQRSELGKAFDRAVFALGATDTRSPEEKAIDDEVLQMKPLPTRVAKSAIKALFEKKEQTEEEKCVECRVAILVD